MAPRAPWVSALALSMLVTSTAAAQSAPGLPAPGLPPAAGGQGSAPPEPPAPGTTVIYSPGLVIAGALFIGAGLVAVTGGAIFFGTSSSYTFNDAHTLPGKVALIGGGGAILVGLPLVLIGAHRVPATVALPAGFPRLAASPRSVSASWSF